MPPSTRWMSMSWPTISMCCRECTREYCKNYWQIPDASRYGARMVGCLLHSWNRLLLHWMGGVRRVAYSPGMEKAPYHSSATCHSARSLKIFLRKADDES